MSEKIIKQDAERQDMNQVIEQWVGDHFRGSHEFAGNTLVWNLLIKAIDDLKKRLK
jgi:hypothetical protein